MTWTITRVPVPDALDATQAWAVHAMAQVSAAVERDHWGNDDLAASALFMATHLSRQDYTTRIALVATAAGTALPGRPADVVGSAGMSMPKQGNEHIAMIGIGVRPEHRRVGAGRALLAECERIAREHGRTTLILESAHPHEPAADDPAALVAPTGSGRVRRSDAGSAFALGAGYVLEQAERYSVLELPVDPELLDRRHADAAEHAGPDYRLVSWSDAVPEKWLDALAELETRMSTDAPVGGLDIDEDPWTGERVRHFEADIIARDHGFLVVAAEHVPSGTLAAFTMVEYPLAQPEVVFQEDTLVLREHRGHRLGMLVKADLLRRLAVTRPQARRVHTWNAEENAYMLGINVALGFRPTGVYGAWQKRLVSAGDDSDRAGVGAQADLLVG